MTNVIPASGQKGVGQSDPQLHRVAGLAGLLTLIVGLILKQLWETGATHFVSASHLYLYLQPDPKGLQDP